jgi:endonuclease V-like protein UPF0215 family
MHDLRIVGIDDGTFRPSRHASEHALLVAVLFQGLRVKAVRTNRIEVDGRDSNARMVTLLRAMRYDVAMLSGVSFGGFNVVDIAELARVTKRPVIALSGEKPHNAAVFRALHKHFKDWKERWAAVQNAGPIHSCKPLRNEPSLFFEVSGISSAYARSIIRSTATISRLPEPIRVTRILARTLSRLDFVSPGT